MLICHGIANKVSSREPRKADQLKRSSGSIPDNIAECYGSYYYNDKIKSLHVARKETSETQNHLISLVDLGYLDRETANRLIGRYEGLMVGINKYRKKIIDSREEYKSSRLSL